MTTGNPFDNVPDRAQAGYPVGPVLFSSTQITTLPYPTINPDGTQPPQLDHCVITNYSPYPLIVSSLQVLGVLAPYSEDVYYIGAGPSSGGFSLSVFTIPTTDTFAPFAVPLSPGLAWGVWYEGTPPDTTYPRTLANFGPNILPHNTIAINGGAGPFTFSLTPDPFAQSWAVGVGQVGGTATGLRITLGEYQTLYPLGAWGSLGEVQGFFIVPGFVGGIKIECILNKALGGTFSGLVNLYKLTGLVDHPRLSLPQLAVTGPGNQAEVTVPASSTVNAIPAPPTGTVIRVRGISGVYTAAPATPQTIVLRGVSTVKPYWRGICPTAVAAVSNAGIQNFLVASNVALADPTESLEVVNNASTTLIFVIDYDIIPWPQVTSDSGG